MNVYRVDLHGSGLAPGYYTTETASNARMKAALTLVDIGYYRTVGDAFRAMKVRRVGCRWPKLRGIE